MRNWTGSRQKRCWWATYLVPFSRSFTGDTYLWVTGTQEEHKAGINQGATDISPSTRRTYWEYCIIMSHWLQLNSCSNEDESVPCVSLQVCGSSPQYIQQRSNCQFTFNWNIRLCVPAKINYPLVSSSASSHRRHVQLLFSGERAHFLVSVSTASQQDKARGTRELGVLRKWVIERGIVGYNEVLCSVLVFVCCRVAQGPW